MRNKHVLMLMLTVLVSCTNGLFDQLGRSRNAPVITPPEVDSMLEENTIVIHWDADEDAAFFVPPASGDGSELPREDQRFRALYTFGENACNLRSDWQTRCSPEVCAAIAEYGYFIPRLIPYSVFLKLYLTASDNKGGNDFSDRALLLAYKFIPEKQQFEWQDNRADAVVLEHAATVWTAAEKESLAGYRWLDGSRIHPVMSPGGATYTQTKALTPPLRIYTGAETYPVGALVVDKGYLLDRIYAESDSFPLYELWLQRSDSGAWEVHREDSLGSGRDTGSLGVSENGAVITRESQRIEY